MKKRILTVLLALILCLGILPTAAFAQDEDQRSVIQGPLEGTIPKPEVDQQITAKYNQVTVPPQSHYRARVDTWSFETMDEDGNAYMSTINPSFYAEFQAGAYMIDVEFKSEWGYRFPSTFEGARIQVGTDDEWLLLDYTTFSDTEIRAKGIVYVGDVPRRTMLNKISASVSTPVVGEKPVYTVQAPEGAADSTEVMKWFDSTADKTMKPTKTFQQGHQYQVTLSFTVDNNSYFTNRNAMQVSMEDTNGPVDGHIIEENQYTYNVIINFDLRGPTFTGCHPTILIPKEGMKWNEMPEPVLPEGEDERFTLCVSYRPSDDPNPHPDMPNYGIFAKGTEYTATYEIKPKEGYRLLDAIEIILTDQYGTRIPIESYSYAGGIDPTGKPIKFIQFDHQFKPLDAPDVTFKVENGKWKDGSVTDKRLPLQSGENGYVLMEEMIPTGMIPNEGYGDGKWVPVPNTTPGDITQNTTYVYRLEKVQYATVTMKIVNGQWKVDKTDGNKPFHSDDIVVKLRMTDGKATLSSMQIPDTIKSNPDCIPAGWDVKPNTAVGAITGDVTYTFTCKQVVTAPIDYALNYVANGGTGAPPAETKTTVEGVADFVISSVIPTRAGYAFTGWGLEKNDTSTVYIGGTDISRHSDVTLYAQWEKVTAPDPGKPDPEKPDQPKPENPDKPAANPAVPATGDGGLALPTLLMALCTTAFLIIRRRAR